MSKKTGAESLDLVCFECHCGSRLQSLSFVDPPGAWFPLPTVSAAAVRQEPSDSQLEAEWSAPEAELLACRLDETVQRLKLLLLLQHLQGQHC